MSLKSYQNSNSLHDSDTIHNIGLNSLNPHIVLVWPQFNTFIILFETYREVQKILWRPVVVIVDCVDITLEHSWPSWSGQNTLWRLSWHYIIIRPGSGSSQLMAVHQSSVQTVQWPSGVTAAHMPSAQWSHHASSALPDVKIRGWAAIFLVISFSAHKFVLLADGAGRKMNQIVCNLVYLHELWTRLIELANKNSAQIPATANFDRGQPATVLLPPRPGIRYLGLYNILSL